MGLANFLYFWSILTVFWLKNGQKTPKYKKSFFIAFSLLGSIYIPNFRKFHQMVWILAIFLFFYFCCFLVKKRPKKAEIEKKFFCSIFFVGKHLHTKFQKISSNGLDFANFYFLNRKSGSGEFSFTKRYLHTKFQKISSNGSQDNL